MKVSKVLQSFSAFSRPTSDLVSQTVHGALVTCAGCLLAFILFVSEVCNYIYAEPVYEIGVHAARHAELDINLDVVLPRLPCAILSMDLRDSTGEAVSDTAGAGSEGHMSLHKVRLDKAGRALGRKGEYKMPEPDAVGFVGGMLVMDSEQHIKDMNAEMGEDEGCWLYGTVQTRLLNGMFRVTVHMKDFMLLQNTQKRIEADLHDAAEAAKHHHGSVEFHVDYSRVNMTHHIRSLRFGPGYPGRLNPLDNVRRAVDHDYGTFRYFLTILPATFVSPWWTSTSTFVYSVSEYFLPGSAHARPAKYAAVGTSGGQAGGGQPGVNVEQMPALEFHLNMSPLSMKVWYPQRTLGHFIVRLCAVLGGCFALTRWADGVTDACVQLLGSGSQVRWNAH